LVDPSEKKLISLKACIESLKCLDSITLNYEESLFCRIALGWCDVFGIATSLDLNSIRSKVGKLKTQSSTHIPLTIEFLFLQLVIARLSKSPQRDEYCRHRLNDALLLHPKGLSDLYISRLIQLSASESFDLKSCLNPIEISLPTITRKEESPFSHENEFRFNILTRTASWRLGNEKIYQTELNDNESKLVAMALSLQEKLPVDKVVSSLWGYSTFKQHRHDAKLNNLIYSINKKLALVIRFRKRGLFVEVSKSNGVNFLSLTPIHDLVSLTGQQSNFRSMHETKRSLVPEDCKVPNIVKEEKSAGMWMSRACLQTKLHMSKSSTHRLIQKLLENRQIIRTGSGRNSEYFFEKNLIFKISTKGNNNADLL
jgi:hypothetical protein